MRYSGGLEAKNTSRPRHEYTANTRATKRNLMPFLLLVPKKQAKVSKGPLPRPDRATEQQRPLFPLSLRRYGPAHHPTKRRRMRWSATAMWKPFGLFDPPHFLHMHASCHKTFL